MHKRTKGVIVDVELNITTCCIEYIFKIDINGNIKLFKHSCPLTSYNDLYNFICDVKDNLLVAKVESFLKLKGCYIICNRDERGSIKGIKFVDICSSIPIFDASMWLDFLDGKLYVNCSTKEASDEFLNILNLLKVCRLGVDLLSHCNYNIFKDKTCYILKDYCIYYSDISEILKSNNVRIAKYINNIDIKGKIKNGT